MQPRTGFDFATLLPNRQWTPALKIKRLLLIAIIPAFTTLSACGAWWLPRPHKLAIQQGNLLSQKDVEQIKVGMTRGQVVNILGVPVTTNQINPDRWEYIYSLSRAGTDQVVRRISLQFENEKVAALEVEGFSDS